MRRQDLLCVLAAITSAGAIFLPWISGVEGFFLSDTASLGPLDIPLRFLWTDVSSMTSAKSGHEPAFAIFIFLLTISIYVSKQFSPLARRGVLLALGILSLCISAIFTQRLLSLVSVTEGAGSLLRHTGPGLYLFVFSGPLTVLAGITTRTHNETNKENINASQTVHEYGHSHIPPAEQRMPTAYAETTAINAQLPAMQVPPLLPSGEEVPETSVLPLASHATQQDLYQDIYAEGSWGPSSQSASSDPKVTISPEPLSSPPPATTGPVSAVTDFLSVQADPETWSSAESRKKTNEAPETTVLHEKDQHTGEEHDTWGSKKSTPDFYPVVPSPGEAVTEQIVFPARPSTSQPWLTEKTATQDETRLFPRGDIMEERRQETEIFKIQTETTPPVNREETRGEIREETPEK